VGRTIGGRYLVMELVGSGGMGAVYRGRHQLVGRDVALKFLAPRYARDPAARERFLREARAANRIDHEHIIDITDFGETSDNLVFLVMEFLDGVPLSGLIEQGPLPPRRALNIAYQLATALARAHELDVIHRDIKPDNIFVLQRRGGDFVKLLDFGLAKVVGEHRLTATGKVFGTPEYLAPEQARGEQLTGAADQYALGCVLFEMLTMQLPFEGPGPEVVLAHLQQQPPLPSTFNPQLPRSGELDALVLRMLAKHPSERFADAYHLADELRGLMDRLEVSGARPAKAQRRSGPIAVLTPPTAATQPWVDAAEETWAQRVEVYATFVPQAFPYEGIPYALQRSLEDARQLVARARSLRQQLGDNVLRAKEQEDSMREGRLRVGRAVDELGQDESRVTRRIAEYELAVREAEARLGELEAPMVEAWCAIPPVRGEHVPLSRALAEHFKQLGGAASLWLDAEAQLSLQRSRLTAAEREREDLRFQVAQLKGRLGIVNADGETELSSLREQAEGLEAELSRTIDGLAAVVEPLARALIEVPGLSDALTRAALASGGPRLAGRG
jgi:serine/threonine-protein kinase